MAITIISFSAGTTIRSADMNSNFTALTNALSGATANNFTFLATANTNIPLTVITPSLPAADTDLLATQVTGDTVGRASFYVRNADGYGGIRVSVGAAYIANMYGATTGWVIPTITYFQTTLGGGNKNVFDMNATDGKRYGFNMNTDNSISIFNYTDSVETLRLGPTAGLAKINSNQLATMKSAGGGSAGTFVWVGTTDPAGSAGEGDLWIDA